LISLLSLDFTLISETEFFRAAASYFLKMFTKISIPFLFVLMFAAFTAGCSAQVSEQAALQQLRDMTAGGKMPSESAVKAVEDRFGRTRTGLLARLLRARIKFQNKDYAGTAALLDTNDFKDLTELGDYALWLRGSALQNAGDDKGAMAVFEALFRDFPQSLRAADSKILWAASALRTDRAADVAAMLADLRKENSAQGYMATANAYQSLNDNAKAIKNYRKAYLFGGDSAAGKEAAAKL